jgi:hypothetical protein
MKNEEITPEMMTAVNEPIERAFSADDIKGLIIVEVFGGMFRVYHPEKKQALKTKFHSIEKMRQWLITRGIIERI